jgi:hypothetical protein
MAINRVSQSSIQQAFPKFNTAWDGVSAVGGMDAISAFTLTANTASVTFNNIPQTYTHLQIRTFAAATSASSAIKVVLNTDTTGANYYRHMLYGNGSSNPATSGTSAYIGPVFLSGTANIFSGGIADIHDYTNTNKYKPARVLHGTDINSSGVIEIDSFVWLNTAAITSIQLISDVGSFVTYSSFALYGIK